MPSVQQTAAFSGLRPVANAFGACGRRDVELRHRLAGPGRELADDAVHRRGLRLADRVGVHRPDRELVGVPVAVDRRRDADQREDEQEDAVAQPGGDDPAEDEEEGPHAAEQGSGLQPVVVLVHVCSQRGGVGGSFRQDSRPRSSPGSTLNSTRMPVPTHEHAPSPRARGPARARRAPSEPARVRLAEQQGEPAQVDGDAEHDRHHGDQGERPQPGVDDRAQGHDLGDQADDAGRQAREHEQREGQRATGQPVAAQQAAACARAARPPRPTTAAKATRVATAYTST